MSKYHFDKKFVEIFRKIGIDLQELLRRAKLPRELFNRKRISLTCGEYFRLVEALGTWESEIPNLTELIAIDGRIETLSPPIYAAYCSTNGLEFITRFAQYKRLVGPVKLSIIETSDYMEIEVLSEDKDEPLPDFFAELELTFLVGVLEKATQSSIHPLQTGPTVLLLNRAELERPFKTHNETMWQYMEPELRRRLYEMNQEEKLSAKVYKILVEQLPLGNLTMEKVAQRFNMSRRTLLRNLQQEGTTYEELLHSVRMSFAQDYLKNTQRSTNDIAFLLGYNNQSSFIRAFSRWTGTTVTKYKKENQHTSSLSTPPRRRRRKK